MYGFMNATSKRVNVRSRRNTDKATGAGSTDKAAKRKKDTGKPHHGEAAHEGLFDPHKRTGQSTLHERLIKNFGHKMQVLNRPWVHEHHKHSRGR